MATASSSPRAPSQGPINQIKDRATVDTLRLALSRTATLEQAVARLVKVALQSTAAMNARNQLVTFLRDPVNGQDAVNLRSMKRYVDNQLAVIRQSLNQAIDNQDQVGGGALVGGGSAQPTIEYSSVDFTAASEFYGSAHATELANSCQRAGGTWDYMDGLLAYIRTLPNGERVGYNGKRGDTGDPSLDAFAVFHGVLPPVVGSNDVWVIDVIGCHCGPEDGESCVPRPTWSNNTIRGVAGAWLLTRP